MKIIYSTESPKIKNLVLNEEYEVIEELSDHYLLTNNSGVTIPYSKRFFSLAKKPYVPRVIIEGFNSDGAAGNYLGKIRIRIDNFNASLTVYTSDISCGMKFIQNINGILDCLIRATLSVEECSIILSEILLAARNILKTTFLIFSTNDDQKEIIERTLAILSGKDLIVETPWMINANSDNPIKTFIIKTEFIEQYDNDENRIYEIVDSNFEYNWINGDIFQS